MFSQYSQPWTEDVWQMYKTKLLERKLDTTLEKNLEEPYTVDYIKYIRKSLGYPDALLYYLTNISSEFLIDDIFYKFKVTDCFKPCLIPEGIDHVDDDYWDTLYYLDDTVQYNDGMENLGWIENGCCDYNIVIQGKNIGSIWKLYNDGESLDKVYLNLYDFLHNQIEK